MKMEADIERIRVLEVQLQELWDEVISIEHRLTQMEMTKKEKP